MTVSQAAVEQLFQEVGATRPTATAVSRVLIWLAVERREGGVWALRRAAQLWRKGRPSLVGHFLNALADRLAVGEQL